MSPAIFSMAFGSKLITSQVSALAAALATTIPIASIRRQQCQRSRRDPVEWLTASLSGSQRARLCRLLLAQRARGEDRASGCGRED